VDLIIRNARVSPTLRHGPAVFDVAIDADRIAAVAPAGDLPAGSAAREIDADGGLVSPPFADTHIHLDSVLTVGDPTHNESGTLIEGILTWAERKKTLDHDDVKRRAREAILWKVSQGTGFIRSHVDVCTALRALLELREEVREIVDLELIAFPQDGVLSFPDGEALMREAMRLGCDVVGGIPHYELTREDGIEEVGIVFDIARDFDKPLDLHCDETDDDHSRFLEHVAARTIRDGLHGRVAASHVTAMASYNDAYAFKLLQILKRAGVTIVANPLTNILLQGRFDTYPKRRGVTRVKELDAAGVNVACGYDCIMDPWYPLGTGSMLDALFMLVHAAHMSGRSELFRAFDMVSRNPLLGAARDWTIESGKPANLMLLDCSDEVEAIRLRPAVRTVIREGRVVAETEPARTHVYVDGAEVALETDGALAVRPASTM
jgi:cytosine deaminase